MSVAVDMDGEDTLPVRGHGLPVARYSDDGAWREHARCRTEARSTFFVEGARGGDIKAMRAAKEIAFLICAECPSRLRCLNFAVRNDEPHGIWGGVDFSKLKRAERDALIVRLDKLNVR